MDESELAGVISRALGSGAAAEAIACYARWWQLETYVREVLYTELRCAYGAGWVAELGEAAPQRAEGDRVNRYMASADAEDLLSYANASVLFKIVDRHWQLFEGVLLPKVRWAGLVDTLLAIRNRIAHCRRPHPRDLARIEMTLEDLESGAREFYGSYGDTSRAGKDRRDPLVRAWVDERHDAAARLIGHCERNYETRFRLSHSVRPWAKQPVSGSTISGAEGAIWQAGWLTGGRSLDPEEMWRELQPRTRELLLHLLFEGGGATATFAAVEAPEEVADAIGDVFDTLIETSREFTPGGGTAAIEVEIARMREGVARLPAKVQYNSALAMFDPLNPEAFTLFGA